MPARTSMPQSFDDLRLLAATRLGGVAVAQGAPLRSTEALRVLHDLAASPDTAADALALLHELQVHQVEVDLQAEAMSDSRAELESVLRRQIELYDALPVGCLTIDCALVVHELNLTASRMLGIARDEAYGLALDTFLTPECERAVRRLVSNIAEGRAGTASALQLMPKHGRVCPVRAHVSADPAGERGERFLLVLADAGDTPASPADAAR